MKLFDGQTVDGTSQVVDGRGRTNHMKSVETTVYAYGGFGGGTATIQISMDGTNYVTVSGISITAAGAYTFTHRWNYARAVLAGATGATLSLSLM